MASLIVFTLSMVLLSNISNSQLVNCKGSTCICPSKSGKTCTLDCDDVDICKESALHCRSGDACDIYCSAITSCSSGTTIHGGTATDVTITCSAEDSCKDNINIICGTGHCKLQCDHYKACLDWGSIDVSLSSSFECTGDCPKNIPAPFSSKLPTINPTNIAMIPTINNNNNPTSTDLTPTMSPVTYVVVPHETVETKDKDKDLTTKSGTIQGFDIAIIGVIAMAFCIVCVVIVWLFYMSCNKRKMRRRMRRKKAASHKRTISNSSFRQLPHKNAEFKHHNPPSMDMIIMATETPIRSPILCLPETNGDGETLLNEEIEIEVSKTLSKTFTIESIIQHQQTTRSSSNDNEDTDDDDTDDDDNEEISNNTTPPALPGIPDHKAVTQSVNDLISQVKHFENDVMRKIESESKGSAD